MNRQWLYAKQPAGKIGKDTFAWRESAIPTPAEGEVLVRTRMLSLDPANRAWMMGKTYRDALEPGQVMSGFVIGEVVDSKAPGLARGDIVEGDWGWQDYAALPARRLTKRTTNAPLEMLIGPLSVTGLTAYFGLLEVGRPKPGDTVLVSAAAGAVGSMVGHRQDRRLPRRRHGGRQGQVRLVDERARLRRGGRLQIRQRLPRAAGSVSQRHRRLLR